MIPAYTITSQPSCEPITYDQAAAHVRVDRTDDQAYISDLIPVAREYVDGVTGRASIQTSWKCTARNWYDCSNARLTRSNFTGLRSWPCNPLSITPSMRPS